MVAPKNVLRILSILKKFLSLFICFHEYELFPHVGTEFFTEYTKHCKKCGKIKL